MRIIFFHREESNPNCQQHHSQIMKSLVGNMVIWYTQSD